MRVLISCQSHTHGECAGWEEDDPDDDDDLFGAGSWGRQAIGATAQGGAGQGDKQGFNSRNGDKGRR